MANQVFFPKIFIHETTRARTNRYRCEARPAEPFETLTSPMSPRGCWTDLRSVK